MKSYYWSDKFNALPIEVRTIACAVSCAERIRDLEHQRLMAINAHRRHLKEIDDQIKARVEWREREFPVPSKGEQQ